jgi:hypothetical protein
VRIEVEHDDGSTSNLEHELDFDGAPSKEEMQAEAGDPEPTRRVLVLSTHDTQSVADEVIESLSGAGIVVSDPGSLAGAPWSKELLEAIRSVDEVVTVGNADRIQYRIEADMAEKLGKRIWRIETPTDTPNETPTVTTASHGSRPTRALSFDADLLRGGGLVEAFRKKS